MVKLDIKGFQETLHAGMCGPASLKIILDYYGLVKSEKELAELMEATALGTDDQSIARTAVSLGYRAEVKNESDFSDIEAWLLKGVPVIVDWFSRGRIDYSLSAIADGHYSVIIGLNDDHIYLQDPEIGGLREISRNDFMKVWFDFKGEHPVADEFILRQLIAIYK